MVVIGVMITCLVLNVHRGNIASVSPIVLVSRANCLRLLPQCKDVAHVVFTDGSGSYGTVSSHRHSIVDTALYVYQAPMLMAICNIN